MDTAEQIITEIMEGYVQKCRGCLGAGTMQTVRIQPCHYCNGEGVKIRDISTLYRDIKIIYNKMKEANGSRTNKKTTSNK